MIVSIYHCLIDYSLMSEKLSLLMVSFHFPPISQSSGYLRALKFAKYLPEYNVEPTILTVNLRAYKLIDLENSKLLNQLDNNIEIHKAQCWDSSKHFAIFGKYFSWLAMPDKWVSWIPFGIIKGWQLNKKKKFDALWVTYPISSALFIGYFLAKLTKKILYVDLRDPVWEEETWDNTTQQKILRWIENKIIYQAEKIIFTSPGTIEKYKNRYSESVHAKFVLITNGYDEDDFQELLTLPKPAKKVFLHSGLLPKYERDPSCFFQAILELKNEGILNGDDILFRFRATGHDETYHKLIRKLNIADLVELAERKDYKYALSEMYTADVLMIFQHRTCDWQIPAKLFEYFRVQKPLLVLAGKNSDTLAVLKTSKATYFQSEIDDIANIKIAIKDILTNNKTANVSSVLFSREKCTENFANILLSS